MQRGAPFRRRIAVRAGLIALSVSVGAAACGVADTGGAAVDTGRSSAPTTGFDAVTIDNCGVTTHYERPTERVLPIDQNVTELLLALGLQERIVAHARVHFDPTDPVLREFADEYAALRLLGNSEPTREVVLALEPELAVAEFGFGPASGLTVESLRADGIATYVLPDQCEGRDEPVGFDDRATAIRELGAIFGVADRAESLVADGEATLDEVARRVADREPVSVFVYDSGDDAPFTVGGTGLSNAIIDAAGGVNVFADVDRQFFTASWEEALAADPELIVIMNYFHGDDGETTASKRAVVESRLASTAAVRDGRIVDLPLTGFLLGVRNPDSVRALAAALHP